MSRKEVTYLVLLILVGSIGFYFYNKHLNTDPGDDAVETLDSEVEAVVGGVGTDAAETTSGADLYNVLPGFYREINQKTQQETKNFLLITADLTLYKLLMTQVKYGREYIGVLGGDALKVRPDGSFIYDVYQGRPINDQAWESHTQLDSIRKVNVLCTQLMKKMNRFGIELSLRLDREKPEFSDKQMRLLRLMINDPQKLVTFMQDRGFETIWINDYLNENLYNLSGYLVVPASIKDEPEVIFNAIADGSYVLESMD